MIAPIVHLNGTSAERLIEAYEGAYAAGTAFLDALAATAPNARDYYVHPDRGAFETAFREHEERVRRVQGVLTELHGLAGRVADQRDGRVAPEESDVLPF